MIPGSQADADDFERTFPWLDSILPPLPGQKARTEHYDDDDDDDEEDWYRLPYTDC